MFGLSISTVIGAHSADILDALFSFPVTSIDTKGRLHSFRQRFQVFMDNIYLTTCVFVNFFFHRQSHAKLSIHLTRNLVYGKKQDKHTHSCTVIHVLEWTMCLSVYSMCFMVTATWNLFACCLGIYFPDDYKVQICLYGFVMEQLYSPGK